MKMKTHARGFTLIEIMVATMLLAMLVTILTMIFNQSSIAWSTGVASVTALGDTREEMSVCAREAEDVLVSDDGSQILGVSSVWENWDASSRTWKKDTDPAAVRPLRRFSDFEEKFRKHNVGVNNVIEPLQDKTVTISGGSAAGRDSYLVGVHSYGPDGKTGGDFSWDDISTMPEEIVK